jgi:UDP-2,3-diacylglucosamine hydrolase
MKIASISDLHIKSQEDEASKILMRFFRHNHTVSADAIFLLGDIFDLMVGPHATYEKQFSEFFLECEKIIKRGQKLYFIEGNHDVHIRKLFFRYFSARNIDYKDRFFIFQSPIELKSKNFKYLFSHGDEYDFENTNYQNYKNFIYKPFMRFIGENVVPYHLINFLGTRASKISRKAGKKNFDKEKVRLKIRNGVEKIITGKFHFIVGGHSHVLDEYKTSHNSIYINNGFPLLDKKFILIEDEKYQFIDL